MSATPESLQKFIDFCQQHITGKERKEAQIFLDRFFQAFGYEGVLEAGATYEEAVAKGSKQGKTGFADLVWKPRFINKIYFNSMAGNERTLARKQPTATPNRSPHPRTASW